MSLRQRYLVAYGLMVTGDWLQGPYIYALYSDYGYSQETIAQLFVVGFASSMILGTFIGSLADKWGRKKMALCYCLLYIISCITKHNRTLEWLFFGRLTGGAATSLLMSIFESWLVRENAKQGASDEYLSNTLSYATLLNSIIAIASGLLAESVVRAFPLNRSMDTPGDWFFGGYTGPFDLAIVALAIGAAFIGANWNENYGAGGESAGRGGTLKDGFRLVWGNSIVLCLGLAQGCFEGAMYCFVFMWTPAILSKAGDEKPALGTIFSIFMIGCMVGSQLFGVMMKRNYTPERILVFVFAASCVLLALRPLDDLIGTNLQFYGFTLFEVCVGVYFPAMGTLKSTVVPEEMRSTIYNIYRIPLNAIVLAVLLSGTGVTTTLSICSFLLFVATFLQLYILGAQRYAKLTSSDLDIETP